MATRTRISGGTEYVFQKIARGLPDGLSLTQGNRKLETRKWFREQAALVNSLDARRFTGGASSERRTNIISINDIGKMYMFWYDAKHKDTLPYWDRLPLIFPIEMYNDGFLGINLHYLPPVYRARLMDQLYSTMSNERYDTTTKLRIRYQILKSAQKFRYFKPCIKRYLDNHVASQFIRIEPTEWDMALMLPTERFVKQRKQTVWQDSVRKINGR